jgi:cell division protein FtsB
MKKTAFLTLFATLTVFALTGCQQLQDQADKVKTDVTRSYESTSQEVVKTKNQIDKKVKEVNDAAAAIKKVTE